MVHFLALALAIKTLLIWCATNMESIKAARESMQYDQGLHNKLKYHTYHKYSDTLLLTNLVHKFEQFKFTTC